MIFRRECLWFADLIASWCDRIVRVSGRYDRAMRLLIIMVLMVSSAPVAAATLAIDGQWQEQKIPFMTSNSFVRDDEGVDIISDGGFSLLYRFLPRDLWMSSRGRWHWIVKDSVVATDLAVKGGDDRNVSVYFLFLPEAIAHAADDLGLSKVLRHKQMRALAYVHGGSYPRGEILASPYIEDRMVTIPLHAAIPGDTVEDVDLADDFMRAFGTEPSRLVGIGISADSDDTKGLIRARVEGLMLD